MPLDPTTVRLSEHFLLSDFVGTHSVYSKGFANVFDGDESDPRLGNGRALCEHALEPILGMAGPLSISYGFISPDLSRRVVTYQDPNQPSHHRWDLGAAADIRVHDWVDRPDDKSAPIFLAHGINRAGVPYSRLITYSESPYICVAVRADEVRAGNPRRAFYENRYEGKPKAKPKYTSLASERARREHFNELAMYGLAHDWRGAGYPTYHNGGQRKYQHTQVSRYTTVSDWLFDLQSIATGARNIPSFGLDSVQDAFAAAGLLYDAILREADLKRMSIVAGYVSHTNPFFDPARDWRSGEITFTVVPPDSTKPSELARICKSFPCAARIDEDRVHITASVDDVLEAQDL